VIETWGNLSGGETEPGACGALHETYAHLYVGDYFADTLDLTVIEHVALRLLLLETWVRGPVGNVRRIDARGMADRKTGDSAFAARCAASNCRKPQAHSRL
jgi:uncharacterized protein YdaU (DUF1376 family)